VSYNYLPVPFIDAISGEEIMPDTRTNHVLLKITTPYLSDGVPIAGWDPVVRHQYLTPTDARTLGMKLIELAYAVTGEQVHRDGVEYLRRSLRIDAPVGSSQIHGIELSPKATEAIEAQIGGYVIDHPVTPNDLAAVLVRADDGSIDLSQDDVAAIVKVLGALIADAEATK